MSEEQLSDEGVVQEIYALAAEQMRSGASGPEIQSMLVEKGLNQEAAATVIENLTSMRSEAVRSAGRKNMLYGALWCIGGIVITAVTYTSARPGGTYLVTWGAIVFGAIQFFRGLMQSSGE